MDQIRELELRSSYPDAERLDALLRLMIQAFMGESIRNCPMRFHGTYRHGWFFQKAVKTTEENAQ
jgi:hypothetical protein